MKNTHSKKSKSVTLYVWPLVIIGIILIYLACRGCEDNMEKNNIKIMPTPTPNSASLMHHQRTIESIA